MLPSAAAFLVHGGKAAILIKPQFEAGRENIGKNGLVTSPRVHQNVLVNTLELLHQLELEVQLLCPSPIRGGTGNAEYLAVAEKGGTPAAIPDLAAVVQAALAKEGRK